MSKSRLELRSPLWIALAYVVSPICGLTAWFGLGLVFVGGADKIVDPWIITMAVGMPVCLLVEVVLVTPILVGFHRYRWPWLNGWSAAALGFVLSAAGWVLLTRALADNDGEAAAGVWRLIMMQAAAAAWGGVVGLVGAFVFRLIAVRPSLLPGRLWEL